MGLGGAFGRVLGRFWEHFGRAWGSFWEGFGRVLGGSGSFLGKSSVFKGSYVFFYCFLVFLAVFLVILSTSPQFLDLDAALACFALLYHVELDLNLNSSTLTFLTWCYILRQLLHVCALPVPY